MTNAPETVSEALLLLAEEGYTEDFNLRDRVTVCPQCSTTHELDDKVIERQFRFEGESDPGDEAIVLGIHCPSCKARGVLVSAYGPDADPELLTHLEYPPHA